MSKGNVTEQEKETMNELYLTIGTYAGVAREVGRSASTVKRYIVPNYVAKADRQVLDFNEDRWNELVEYVPKYDDFMEYGASLQTATEREEMEDLWQVLGV